MFSLLFIQTFTYLTIGHKQLKNKLLPDYFAKLTHNSDSIFVRDFYVSECFTGETKNYLSHNLSSEVEFIKNKFNINYVYFDSKEKFNWDDSTEKNYNLIYQTWATRPNWITLFGLYSVRQIEILQTDRKNEYKREVTYRWFLFLWIPTFEWFETS